MDIATVQINRRSFRTALWPRPRQMVQLVRIAHYIKCSNEIAFNLESCSLHRSIRSVHDHTGQIIDETKAKPEVIAPPGIWALAGSFHQELRHAIGAFDYIQRRTYLAATVCNHSHIAREHLCQPIEISRLDRRCKCGQKLCMFRVDLA